MTGVTAVRDMNHIPELAGGCRGRVRRDILRRGPASDGKSNSQKFKHSRRQHLGASKRARTVATM